MFVPSSPAERVMRQRSLTSLPSRFWIICRVLLSLRFPRCSNYRACTSMLEEQRDPKGFRFLTSHQINAMCSCRTGDVGAREGRLVPRRAVSQHEKPILFPRPCIELHSQVQYVSQCRNIPLSSSRRHTHMNLRCTCN